MWNVKNNSTSVLPRSSSLSEDCDDAIADMTYAPDSPNRCLEERKTRTRKLENKLYQEKEKQWRTKCQFENIHSR